MQFYPSTWHSNASMTAPRLSSFFCVLFSFLHRGINQHFQIRGRQASIRALCVKAHYVVFERRGPNLYNELEALALTTGFLSLRPDGLESVHNVYPARLTLFFLVMQLLSGIEQHQRSYRPAGERRRYQACAWLWPRPRPCGPDDRRVDDPRPPVGDPLASRPCVPPESTRP